MRTFEQLPTTKKGDIGEAIVRAQLEAWGYILYPAPACPHPVDFIAFKAGEFTAIEVKTYPRMFTRPVTGIDRADYETYKDIRNQMPVKLFFVDEVEGMVYGGRVDLLQHEVQRGFTPSQDKVLFPLSQMTGVRTLTADELEKLREFSAVDYSQYITLPKYFASMTAPATFSETTSI